MVCGLSVLVYHPTLCVQQIDGGMGLLDLIVNKFMITVSLFMRNVFYCLLSDTKMTTLSHRGRSWQDGIRKVKTIPCKPYQLNYVDQ